MTPPAPPWLLAATALWAAWGASWLAASWWRGGTVVAAPRTSYRALLLVALLGFVGLFVEAPGHGHALWRVPAWLGWVAVLLVAAGLAFAWWARLHLGRLWSGGIVRREGHRVIDSGPYAIVRHPIYTGLVSGAVALAAIKATLPSIAGALLLTVAFAAKGRVEERFLAAELGKEAYADYARRTPMLVPFAPR